MVRANLIKLMLGGLCLALLLAGGGWLWLARLDRERLEMPMPGLESARVVVISPGSSLQAVARSLTGEGLLEYPQSFVRQARREELAARIRAGEYRVEPGTTPRQMLDMFVAGRVWLHGITLPEGWSFHQALEAVRDNPYVTRTDLAADREALLQALGLQGRSPEGMLFPDTYLFPRGTTDVEILRQAHGRLESELQAAWAGRQQDLPLDDPYQALILASIVEKETAAPEERPMIAGVFLNRLRLGMKLQTDPTVIYGLGGSFDGNLRRADLLRDTPYNTYTRAGLPPTPIALAGRASLRAAVNPLDTDALYFVATGLGDGRHRFARTLREHNDNVARYIATIRGAAREGPH
jgi:UPF0755 protein